jgi:hypothetical protein
LNLTHRAHYKRYEGKTNDLLIEFTAYANYLNKLQQFKVSVQNSTMDFNALFNSAVLKQERQDNPRKAKRTIVNRVEKCTEFDGGIFVHLL